MTVTVVIFGSNRILNLEFRFQPAAPPGVGRGFELILVKTSDVKLV